MSLKIWRDSQHLLTLDDCFEGVAKPYLVESPDTFIHEIMEPLPLYRLLVRHGFIVLDAISIGVPDIVDNFVK